MGRKPKKAEKAPEKKFDLSPNRIKLDSWLIKTEKRMKEEDCLLRYGGNIYCDQVGKEGFLAVSCTKEGLNRGLRIFEKFIEFIWENEEDFEIYEKVNGESRPFRAAASMAVVKGIQFGVKVKEKNINRKVRVVDCFGDETDSHEIVHSNEFAVVIYTDISRYREFSDTKTIKVEEKFQDMLDHMRAMADEHIEWKERCQIQRQRLEAERQEKEKHEAEVRFRVAVARNISFEMKRFERAKQIRDYIERVKDAAIRNNGLTPALQQKLEIAKSVADWIDPSIDYIDEVLAESHSMGEFL